MNGDVFPPMNLPDDGKGQSAVPWGRAVQGRVEDVEGRVDALSQALGGQNRSNASSLSLIAQQIQALGDQVRDLVGRASYSALDPDLTFRLPNTLSATPWGPSLSFTLAQPRVVSLMFTVGTSYQAAGSASLAYTRGALFIDNVRYVGVSRTESGVSGNATVLSGGDSTLICRAVVSLPAGGHTVQGGYMDTQVIGTSGPSFSYMDLRGPSVFADVLQPT